MLLNLTDACRQAMRRSGDSELQAIASLPEIRCEEATGTAYVPAPREAEHVVPEPGDDEPKMVRTSDGEVRFRLPSGELLAATDEVFHDGRRWRAVDAVANFYMDPSRTFSDRQIKLAVEFALPHAADFFD